jgi:RNA-directed DNA polymerase
VLRKLHRRLETLAQQHELKYSSYGDEFTMSGRKRVTRLKGLMVRIVGQEGFAVNPTKIKDRGRHERQELAGNTVNKKISPGRAAFRELRAILHNCLKFGPENQNRAAHPLFHQHLRGRIAQFEYSNPALGVKLLADFNRIIWPKKVPAR